MAYTKQTWSDYPATSTPINASRLNHIEEGIYDSSMCGPAFDALANEWTTSATYEVGDYVYYNSDVYRCLVSNTATLPTTESTWEKVKIGSELSQLNENIAKLTRTQKKYFTDTLIIEASGNLRVAHFIGVTGSNLSTFTLDAEDRPKCTVACSVRLNGYYGIAGFTSSGSAFSQYNASYGTATTTNSTSQNNWGTVSWVV